MAAVLGHAASDSARTGRWLFALSLCVYVFTAGGSLTTTDAVVAYDLTANIVEHRSLALSGNLLGMDAHRGIDGRYYSPFGIAQSIYNAPFYMAGTLVASHAPMRTVKPDSVPKAAVALGQTLLVAILIWQTFTMAASLATPHAALLAAATCAFGSILWPYASFGFNQPLAAVLLLEAVRTTVRGVREDRNIQLAKAGGWLGLAMLARHELALAALPLALWVVAAGSSSWPQRARRLRAFAPGVVAGVATWLAYNAARFGNPLDSGFLRDSVPGFGSPMVPGIAGLLFSPSASVFLYSPFAVFGVAGIVVLFQRDRHLAGLLSVLCLGALCFYGTLGNWLGGRSYGSRYLLIVIPYLGVGWAVLLDSLRARARVVAFVVVAGLGALVQVPGVLVDYAKVGQAVALRDGGASTRTRQWSWGAAPLVVNTRALVAAVPDNMAYGTGVRPRPDIVAAVAGDRAFSQQFAFSLDLWWLYLFYIGVVARLGVVLVVAAFAMAITLCAAQLGRSARSLAH